MKPLVYIASPYTKGDTGINVWFQMQIWHELVDDGIVTPHVPLLTHFLHLHRPRPYEDWTAYDFEMLAHMGACLRCSAVCDRVGYDLADSSGADAEVAWFEEHGKPVFYDKESLYEWAGGRTD